MDSSQDNRLGFDEFKQSIPMMEKFGLKITDPQNEFDLIDKNKGGIVLFDEFAEYCI